MIKLLILTDEYGFFTESLKTNVMPNSVDVKKIKSYLEEEFGQDLQADIKTFHQLELENTSDFTGCFVIYTSSDDLGLFYKDYIEDILLRLVCAKATLIPDFNLFRAHHNKAYMELYKTTFLSEEENGIKTEVFSSYKMLLRYLKSKPMEYPVVIKTASGAGSCGVGLAKNESELLKLAKRFSYRKYRDNYATLYRTPIMQVIKNRYRSITKKRIIFYKPMQGKFIVQTFIKDLSNDFKVLVFGEKYYVLKRLNRDGDFRASGSGRFVFPDNAKELENVLNYANLIYERLNVPCVSLDIADAGDKNYLIEYQCLDFGPYTLEMSKHYFRKQGGIWEKKISDSELEKEYANALIEYIKRNKLL